MGLLMKPLKWWLFCCRHPTPSAKLIANRFGPMPQALALSDEQRNLVLASATTVPPHWRGRFLAAVQDLLTMHPHPSNREVVAACAAAHRAIGLGVGPPSID
jgi:hypothetical protein